MGMSKSLLSIVGAAALLTILFVAQVPSGARAQNIENGEVRGFWADGFNPAFKTEVEIDTLIARLQKANCNAIFAQVRKRGDAYYFSHYEPRATDNRIPGFDPLATLIKKAHAATPRIQVHAWINTMATAGPSSLGNGHILAKNPQFRSLSDKGEEYDNEAVKIDPGVPGAAEWTTRVYLDVARHYDVDGIHFDFVRYGGPNWGYAIESVQRFNKQFGREGFPKADDADWQQFRRDQVTAIVRKVYANAIAIKPKLVVSAALIPWGDAPSLEEDWLKSAAYTRVYQDWRAWLEEGILDLGCVMTYFRSDRYRNYQINWTRWIREHQFNRAAVVAIGTWFNTPEETFDLARLSRVASEDGRRAAGILLYSYRGTNAVLDAEGQRMEQTYNEAFYELLPTIFPNKVPFPTLKWKVRPTAGHVKGTVLTGDNLAWADGATVTLTGKNGFKRTTRTDGTGHFAFIDVPPAMNALKRLDTYALTMNHEGEEQTVPNIVPRAGTVETRDFVTAGGNLPLPRRVTGIGVYGKGARVMLNRVVVRVGNGVQTDRAFVSDNECTPPIELRLPKPLLLPLVAGDIVTLTATVRKAAGGQTYLEADAVQVVGCQL